MKKRSRIFVHVEERFEEAIDYIKESKNFIYASMFLFFAAVIMGILFSNYLCILDEVLKDIIEKTEGLHGIGMIIFIFNNNVQASFLALILGIAFGIFPVLTLFGNGLIIGYVIDKVSANAGIAELWRLLPHGIFEIHAVFISFGLGIRLGMFIFSKNKIKELKRRFFNSLNVLIYVILPLLLIAALIEGILINILA